MLSNRKKRITSHFSRYSSSYQEDARLQKKIAEKLASFLPELPPSPRILEIGCGTGFLTNCLFQKYPEGSFDITDISEVMVQFCQKETSYKQANYFVMDGESFQNEQRLLKKYDLIVTSMVAQWFDNPIDSLRSLTSLGPLYYASIGSLCFQEWKSCLDINSLSNGMLTVGNWQGVIEEEFIKKNYGDAMGFLKSLKQTGVSMPRQDYTQLTSKELRSVMDLFNKNYKGVVNWHIVYGHLKAETNHS